MHPPDLLDAIKADDVETVRAALSQASRPVRLRDAASGVSLLVIAVFYGRRAIADLLRDVWEPLDLFEAAVIGELPRVRAIVEADPAQVHAVSPDGYPVVTLAATCGHADIVTFLLSNGADVNAVASNGTNYTALTGTVAQGRADMVALLLAHGADASHRYGPGWSSLHEAASNGNIPLIEALLAHGAELNARNDEGATPLRLAMNKERTEAVALLRDRGAIV